MPVVMAGVVVVAAERLLFGASLTPAETCLRSLAAVFCACFLISFMTRADTIFFLGGELLMTPDGVEAGFGKRSLIFVTGMVE